MYCLPWGLFNIKSNTHSHPCLFILSSLVKFRETYFSNTFEHSILQLAQHL